MGSILCGIPDINAVRFVKLNKPAKAVKAVHQDHSLFVLLENGSVATNNPIVRKAAYVVNNYDSYWQFYSIIQALRKLGVISERSWSEYKRRYEGSSTKHKLERDAAYFEKEAKRLGITLTSTQKKLLSSKVHMRKIARREIPK